MPGHTAQHFSQGYAQQDFLGVSHNEICCVQRRKVELDFTSGTVSRKVKRNVALCVRVLTILGFRCVFTLEKKLFSISICVNSYKYFASRRFARAS